MILVRNSMFTLALTFSGWLALSVLKIIPGMNFIAMEASAGLGAIITSVVGLSLHKALLETQLKRLQEEDKKKLLEVYIRNLKEVKSWPKERLFTEVGFHG